MPTEKQRAELKERYHKELVKVGFSKKQADEIVAEAADRLGADMDEPKIVLPPLPAKQVQERKQQRAADVIVMKQLDWDRNRLVRQRVRKNQARITPGRNALDMMRELLAADMQQLAFTQEEIDYILER